MSSNKTAGVNFDDQFDPDVVGDGPMATSYKNAGTALKYAAIKYGSKGPDCDYKQASVDLSNIWAAKGTASYALPINGNSYNSQYIIPPAETGSSFITFSITGSAGAWTYNVKGLTTSGGAHTFASGPCPANAASVMFTWGSYTIDTGDSGGSTSNGAPTKTAISNNIGATYTTDTFNSSSGTRGRIYTFTITLYDASGNTISTTTIQLEASIDGSA